MRSPENLLEENRRLRRTMRDLVAISTLPAVWIGLGPDGVARSLADVLLSTLALELVYIRLTGLAGEGVVELVRTNGPDPADVASVSGALAPLLRTDQAESHATIPDPFGDGALHVAITRFGVGPSHGVLVTGSRNADFPTEQDRVLLGVGANQTAIVLQRREAEERLHEQREWLRVTLASIGDAVIATDTEGRVTYLNSVAEELTGWTPEEAQDKPLETVFPILNEQTREPIENPVVRVLREGSIVGLGNHTILIAKDGVERPIDDSAAPIRDAAGKMIGVVLIFRDVTEQRRAEQVLRASEARKSAILETALDCIITMNHDGKVVEFNPAAERTFGYRRDQVVGQELCQLIIPPLLRQRHREGMARYLATGEGPVLGKRLELPALRADGSEFPVELAITRISTDGPPLFTAYLRDITEAKRVEQHRNARLAVTHVLNQARGAREGARSVLQAVCESLGWDVGFFWIRDAGCDSLMCLQSWHKPDLPVAEFKADSCNRTFQRQEGLPGRVWAAGRPAWILDIRDEGNFPRLAAAVNHQLRSAFACPVIVGEQILGVIEFFSRQIREPDADLLEIMGTVAGNVGQFIERKTAEEELRRSEQELQDARSRLEAALEAGAIATWTWDIPNNRLFTDRNLPRLFNLPAEEAEGALLDNYVQAIHPDDWPRVSAALTRAVETGADYEADYRIVQPDGSVRWVVARGRAERDKTGQSVRMPGVLVDITERKRLEDELRVRVEQLADANRHNEELLVSLQESEGKFRLLANTIPQLAWMARPDGHIFWYNRRWYEYTGTMLEQMEGWGWQSVHDPEVLPKVLERWKAAIASGEPFEMVFPLKGADQGFRPFLTRVNPLKDEEGRTRYWFGTNTDISDIKRMEEALRDADRRKDEFLATLAHELRNPLAPIRTGLEVMKLAKDDPATVEEIRNTMERQTEQLIMLVDDLLDVSRITSGKLELRKCRVKLWDVTQSAVEASKPFIDEAGHELTVSIPVESIHLDADPHRLAQVVSNLLNNAAKYTPEGGRIRLAAERQGSDVVISVTDTGIGIPADMLDRIFEMFAQIDHPIEKGYTGLGIGLTLVKSLVEMHGGSIEVRSEGPNRGSEFRVRLPILLGMAAEEKKPIQPGATATTSPKRRVLVVDDNHAAAEMLSMIVKMLGNEVRTAGDGQEGIEIAAEFLPDMILMDLGMPKMNGYEAARRIRQQPWGEQMMLVALTGWGQEEDKQRTKEAGFDHHLVKPAEPAELQRLLKEMKQPSAP